MIIFNKCKGKNAEFLDTILLVGKQYIYACKCLKEKPVLCNFLYKVHNIYISEMIINTRVTKRLTTKWKQYGKNMV